MKLSHYYCHLRGRHFVIALPTSNRTIELTSGCEVSGLIARIHFFTRGCFIPTRQPSYWNRNLSSLIKSFESTKKREYAERITHDEHGSFTPLVFLSCGGMGFEATVVMKKLAASLAMKRNEPYRRVVTWIRCCLAFSLARSPIRCLWGSLSLRCRTLELVPVDHICAEAGLRTARTAC